MFDSIYKKRLLGLTFTCCLNPNLLNNFEAIYILVGELKKVSSSEMQCLIWTDK